MNITKLNCKECEITIEGTFHSHHFGYLDKDVLDFMEVFILCRGNIKDIEEKLKISYPTVRTKIDKMVEDVIRAKEFETGPDKVK